MRTSYHWLVICLTVLIVSGCANFPAGRQEAPASKPEVGTIPACPQTGTPVTVREQCTADELLIYAKRFRELGADNQKEEYTLISQALKHNRQDTITRLKATLIFAIPGSRYRDNSRALTMLNELQRDKTQAEELATLTALLKDFVNERQGLEENNARLTQKARDEQNRADELQQKLDALKNIEKTLQDRKPTHRK